MIRHRTRSLRAAEQGQILPIFALMIVALLGMAALAIDVSNAYADLRFYRALADAASLAGAQDLQTAGTRVVAPGLLPIAREHALDVVVAELQVPKPAKAGSCNWDADLVDCALPPSNFRVSIKTPSPTCAQCDPAHAVQVTVRDPNYRLTFSNVFGQHQWNVGTTSVSGLAFGTQYAIVTLRPPDHLGGPSYDVKNIVLDGNGTTVTVENGDVGSNANMEYSGVGAELILDPTFFMHHWDNPPLWNTPPGTNPTAKRLNAFIPDPMYPLPVFTGAPTYPNADSARTSAGGPTADATCLTDFNLAKVVYTDIATINPNKVFCYPPGIYTSGGPQARIRVANGEVGLLRPTAAGIGAYWLRKGIDVQNGGHLIGGFRGGERGVAVLLDRCAHLPSCTFDGTAAETLALNMGAAYPAGTGGLYALATLDWANNPVQTPGSSALVLTLMVNRDAGCFVPVPPQLPVEPASCDSGDNETIDMTGGGNLAIAGVLYAPTDNIRIGGNSAGEGEVGQIISWTLKFHGGTEIRQHYPGNLDDGVLRVDAACSGRQVCNY